MKFYFVPNRFVVLILLVLVLLIAVPAIAQDVPLETNTPAVIETEVVGQPPVATDAPPVETLTPTPAPEQPSPLFRPAVLGELLFLLGLSALAGGGLIAIILSFLGRKDVRDRVEDARETWSDSQKEILTLFTDKFEQVTSSVLDFLKAVQDGKPNVDAASFSAPLTIAYDEDLHSRVSALEANYRAATNAVKEALNN